MISRICFQRRVGAYDLLGVRPIYQCSLSIHECTNLALFKNPQRNPYNLSEKYWQYNSNLYRSTPPICNAVKKGKRRNMPPICTAVRLLFVPQYASHCTGSAFEKIPGVGGSGRFLKTGCILGSGRPRCRRPSSTR